MQRALVTEADIEIEGVIDVNRLQLTNVGFGQTGYNDHIRGLLNYRGTWDVSRFYRFNDLVTQDDLLYLCIVEAGVSGIMPPNPSFWFPWSASAISMGPTGLGGPTGPVGATGSDGVTGYTGERGPTGAIGPTGVVGVTGPRGFTGLAGGTGQAGTIISSQLVTGDVNFKITALTPVTALTATVSAGTHSIFFNASGSSSNGNTTYSFGIYLNGTVVLDSTRTFKSNATQTLATFTRLIVGSTSTITVRLFRVGTPSGTLTLPVNNYSLLIISAP